MTRHEELSALFRLIYDALDIDDDDWDGEEYPDDDDDDEVEDGMGWEGHEDDELATDLQAYCVQCGRQPMGEADLDDWADMRRRPTCGECLAAKLAARVPGVRLAG